MANVVVEMSGDEGRLWKSYQKIIDQSKKLDDSTRRIKQTSQDTNRQMEQTFGQQAVSRLGAYVAGFATVNTAVRMFGSAMAAAKAETDMAIASVDALVESRRRLLQVSEGTSGANNQAMNTFADQLSMIGITRKAARDIVFSAKSEGYRGGEAQISRMAAANFLTPESAARAAGQVRGIYDKQITPMQAITGVHEAAFQSRLDIEQYLASFPKLASGGQIAGSTPEETMAIAGYVATKNERAAEYVATMAGQLAIQKDFKGLGIMGMTSKLEGMPEANRQKVLGTGKETNQAYMWLSQGKDIIAERTKDIASAMEDSERFVEVVESRALDPNTPEGRLNRARMERVIAGNELEIRREQGLAEGGMAREVAQARRQAANLDQGPISRWMATKEMEYAAQLKLPPAAVSAIGGAAQFSGVGMAETVVQDLASAAAALFGAARTQQDAATALQDSASNVQRQRAAAAVQPE